VTLPQQSMMIYLLLMRRRTFLSGLWI